MERLLVILAFAAKTPAPYPNQLLPEVMAERVRRSYPQTSGQKGTGNTLLVSLRGPSEMASGNYPRQREYPHPPPPSRNNTRITINKVDILLTSFPFSAMHIGDQSWEPWRDQPLVGDYSLILARLRRAKPPTREWAASESVPKRPSPTCESDVRSPPSSCPSLLQKPRLRGYARPRE